MRTQASQRDGRGADAVTALVVEGASADEVAQLRRSLPQGIVAIPDPDGTISRGFGVRAWPTTMTVNELGLVTGFDVGLDTAARPPRSGEASAS